jgi:ABC-type transport system involved in multi-copper enzyme maturation permease subunit
VAVYERSWRRYAGPTTAIGRRFLVVTRYGLADAFSSKLFVAFYVLCSLPSLAAVLIVYLNYNTSLLEQVPAFQEIARVLAAIFVEWLFVWQAVAAFFVVVIVAPNIVAGDLANGGLSMLLARPIDRRDYVLGKMAVLFLLLSPITWIAGLLVTALRQYMGLEIEGISNLRIAAAYLVGHFVWILVLSLLSLAISVSVRFKPVARGGLFAVFVLLAAFANIVRGVTGSAVGDLIHLLRANVYIVLHILGIGRRDPHLPIAFSWLTLAATCLLSLWLLNRKLRAHEVVR